MYFPDATVRSNICIRHNDAFPGGGERFENAVFVGLRNLRNWQTGRAVIRIVLAFQNRTLFVEPSPLSTPGNPRGEVVGGTEVDVQDSLNGRGATVSILHITPRHFDHGEHFRFQQMLVHELAHAVRWMRGTRRLRVGVRWYEDIEEYYATIVQNVLWSDQGNPRGHFAYGYLGGTLLFRSSATDPFFARLDGAPGSGAGPFSGRVEDLEPADLRELSAQFAADSFHQPLLAQLRRENVDLFNALSQLSRPDFNPFRDL